MKIRDKITQTQNITKRGINIHKLTYKRDQKKGPTEGAVISAKALDFSMFFRQRNTADNHDADILCASTIPR